MATTPSAYMNLPIPTVGVEPGPTWATDINNSLTIIDQHNHTTGQGQQISPSGLNINTDLSIQSNNLTLARSLRLDPQGAPLALGTDLGCLYESGVDLYYNDGNGTQIRLTQSGSIVGTSGSISGLVAPASATYVSAQQVFIWQSNTNTAADMDCGSVTLRNLTASSFGLTLSPPTLSSDYSIQLPALPASQKFMTLDSSGNMAAPWAVDASTIVVSSNTVKVPTGGITVNELATDSVSTAKIIDANVTRPKMVAVGQIVSSSCGSYTSGNTVATQITNLSCTITTTGRPVMYMLISDNSSAGSIQNTGGGSVITVKNGSTTISATNFTAAVIPLGCIVGMDTTVVGAAGTYTYHIFGNCAVSGSFGCFFAKLVVWEL